MHAERNAALQEGQARHCLSLTHRRAPSSPLRDKLSMGSHQSRFCIDHWFDLTEPLSPVLSASKLHPLSKTFIMQEEEGEDTVSQASTSAEMEPKDGHEGGGTPCWWFPRVSKEGRTGRQSLPGTGGEQQVHGGRETSHGKGCLSAEG